MITTKDNLLLDEVDQNTPVIVTIRNKNFKIRAMGNAIAEKFDRYAARAYVKMDDNTSRVTVDFSSNRRLIPKCVSHMVLHGFVKVKLFHWIHWRLLNIKYNQQELGVLMNACMQRWDTGFFLKNMLCLEQNSRMITKIASQNSSTIIAGLKSDRDQT